MELYSSKRNLFSVRLHYNGPFVSNPKLSYVDGKVEYFDCYDSDMFELSSIELWAFRVGLHYGEVALCVYQDPDVFFMCILSGLVTRILLMTLRMSMVIYRLVSPLLSFLRPRVLNELGNGNINNEEVAFDANLVNEESEESNSEGNEEDEAFDVEEVQFGRKEDCYDNGGLAGTEANLFALILEQVEEEYVVPDKDGVSEG
ncbi:hypothetical protein LIER_17073 [Lithospermum erythrorhizon]|uniref:PB1-like domain-containing protein n=1 Tax=Lithospermum erythrorhizon TaxID=34254 RepID=A0AAV3QAD6_LITER